MARHFKLISCKVFSREMRAAIKRSPHRVDLEFLPQGLHDMGCVGMLQRLQAALDQVDESQYEAVLFGYGLCNYGLVGLTAKTIPLVLPRAHDCITLFLGSKERYLDYFNRHPGVYFKTSGWVEYDHQHDELSQLSILHKNKMDQTYEELVAKYGEDNAKYLYQQLYNHARNYHQFTFVEMGVEPDDYFEKQTRQDAEARGWKFEKIKGDMSLIQRMVDGIWDDEGFLVVPPGHRVAVQHDERIIKAEKVSAGVKP